MLTNDEEIIKRWAEYIEKLYTYDRTDPTTEIENYTETKLTEKEIADIIRKLPRQKAAGTDKVTTKCLQALGEKGIGAITAFNKQNI